MTSQKSVQKQARKHQSGSAMVEYSVVTLLGVLILFVPLPGLNESLLNTLLTAFRDFQANTTFLMSLP